MTSWPALIGRAIFLEWHHVANHPRHSDCGPGLAALAGCAGLSARQASAAAGGTVQLFAESAAACSTMPRISAGETAGSFVLTGTYQRPCRAGQGHRRHAGRAQAAEPVADGDPARRAARRRHIRPDDAAGGADDVFELRSSARIPSTRRRTFPNMRVIRTDDAGARACRFDLVAPHLEPFLDTARQGTADHPKGPAHGGAAGARPTGRAMACSGRPISVALLLDPCQLAGII